MNGASAEAKQVAATLDRILADGNLDAIAAEALQALIASACRLYRARREAGEEFAPVPKNSISVTDVMVTASGLLENPLTTLPCSSSGMLGKSDGTLVRDP